MCGCLETLRHVTVVALSMCQRLYLESLLIKVERFGLLLKPKNSIKGNQNDVDFVVGFKKDTFSNPGDNFEE